jgi:putative membrane protein
MAASEPDLRILQANERTLLAWIRTGLALMAFGFVAARLTVWLQLEHPDRGASFPAWLGIAVLALGTACVVIGAHRFVRARSAIVEGRSIAPGSTGPVIVASLVAVAGIAAIAYLVSS